MHNLLCIIPARGGSRRIKNKNILNFFKIPFLGRTILTAKKSKIFDEIIVTSDSKKILRIGKKYGAKNYGLREKKYANDIATTDEMLLHEIKKNNLEKFKYICCIYPATPLLKSKVLVKAFKKFKKGNFDSLLSITTFDYPIFRALKIKNKSIFFKWKKFEKKRSQEIEQMYHDCGYFYFFKTSTFIKNKKFFNKNTGYFKISKDKAVDIDNYVDLSIAKKLFKK
jgi:pseudaminic acid cytidylyltransferase